jgi:hypothetical protein
MRAASASMLAKKRRRCSGSILSQSSNSSAAPRIAAIGVLSSWLTVVANSDTYTACDRSFLVITSSASLKVRTSAGVKPRGTKSDVGSPRAIACALSVMECMGRAMARAKTRLVKTNMAMTDPTDQSRVRRICQRDDNASRPVRDAVTMPIT